MMTPAQRNRIDVQVGVNLDLLCQGQSLTQAALGRLVGVSNTMIRRWETGAARLPVCRMIELPTVLQAAPEEIMAHAARAFRGAL